MNRRRRSPVELLVVPLAVPAIAAAALVGFVNLGAGPQVGTITNRTWVDGELVGRIEAPAPYSPQGEVVVAKLVLPDEYHTANLQMWMRTKGSTGGRDVGRRDAWSLHSHPSVRFARASPRVSGNESGGGDKEGSRAKNATKTERYGL